MFYPPTLTSRFRCRDGRQTARLEGKFPQSPNGIRRREEIEYDYNYDPSSGHSFWSEFPMLLIACLLILTGPSIAQPQVVPLWENGAPGFESRRSEPEEAKDYWVKNVHNPSITVYLPAKEKATGAGMVIAPGGGHRLLVFNAEGRDA